MKDHNFQMLDRNTNDECTSIST